LNRLFIVKPVQIAFGGWSNGCGQILWNRAGFRVALLDESLQDLLGNFRSVLFTHRFGDDFRVTLVINDEPPQDKRVRSLDPPASDLRVNVEHFWELEFHCPNSRTASSPAPAAGWPETLPRRNAAGVR